MLRIAVIAIALWASLPAGVCQALCAPGDTAAVPSCHDPVPSETPATPVERANDCSRCEHVVTPSYANIEVPTSPATLAFTPALALASVTGTLSRVATGVGPPGHANSPYRAANPPLLS
jgi:hypothetical protein